MGLAPGDYYWIASFPRSGSTWLLTILRSCIEDHNPDKHLAPPVHRAWPDPFVHVSPASAWPRSGGRVYYFRTHDRDPAAPPDLTCKGGVYLMRHPLDCWLSYLAREEKLSADEAGEPRDLRQLQAAGRLDESLNAMIAAFGDGADDGFRGSWLDNVRAWTGRAERLGLLILRYEELRERPVERFKAAADTLRIKAGPNKLAQRLEMVDRVSLPRRGGDRGGFQDILTQAQIDRFWAAHGESVEALGYGRDGLL